MVVRKGQKIPSNIERVSDGANLHYVRCTDIYKELHGNKYVTAHYYLLNTNKFIVRDEEFIKQA